MASPPPPSAATSSALFDSQPRGSLSHRTIIIIASILSASLVFTISLAIIHIIRKRRRKKAQTKQQADIETSLQRARPPVLTIDTNVPSIHEPQRSPPGHQMNSALARDIPPIPRIYINEPSLPPIEQHIPIAPVAMWPTHPSLQHGRSPKRNASIPAGVAARSPTRNASLPPGIGGRRSEHIRGKRLAED
ncbi:hypothetical protein J1614_006641 [Plenodomus biglobosus]|nr:hypothetical protein J1614_006641 [Plenodomus biglobosus]